MVSFSVVKTSLVIGYCPFDHSATTTTLLSLESKNGVKLLPISPLHKKCFQGNMKMLYPIYLNLIFLDGGSK